MITDTEIIRDVFLEEIQQQYDKTFRNMGIEHTLQVVTFCNLLAKQAHIPTDLAMIAGYLHDLAYYKSHYHDNHAKRSADLAIAILNEKTHLSQEESNAIIQAINNHSNKDQIHDDLSEVLKDADVLAHALQTTPDTLKPSERKRWENIILT